jgi:hypothetical protein
MKNKFCLLCALTIVFAGASAQTVTVKKQSERVKGENVEGFGTELDGKLSEVSSLWSKFLKEVGRVKLFSSEPVVITEPNFNGTVYQKGTVYAHSFENGSKTRVWLGIVPKEWGEKDVEFATKQTEKLVYQFGIQFNRAKVQNQIDETLQATDAVEKHKQRLINQNKELVIQMSNNEKEKIQLEKSIENNKLEGEALKIKIEKNKKAQDSLVNAAEQIKKVMETHRERLRKIN